MPHSAIAFLGETKGQFLATHGEDGLKRLTETLQRIRERYALDERGRRAAELAVHQIIDGGASLEKARDQWLLSRRLERAAMAGFTGALIWESAGGQTDKGLADRCGINRNTVRKALGR